MTIKQATSFRNIPKIDYAFNDSDYAGAVAMSNFIRTRPHTRMLRWHREATAPTECFVNAGSATRILGPSYDALMFARAWDADCLQKLVASFNSGQGSNPLWRYEVHPAHFVWDHVMEAGRPQDTGQRTDLGHRIIASNPAKGAKFEALLSDNQDGVNGLGMPQLDAHTGVEFPYNSGRIVSHGVYGKLVDDTAKSSSAELLANLEQMCAALDLTTNRLETIYTAAGNEAGLVEIAGLREQLVTSREAVATAQGLATTLWVKKIEAGAQAEVLTDDVSAVQHFERSRP